MGLCFIRAMYVDGAEMDRLCEHAIDFLLTRRGDARQLAVDLVTSHPEQAALEIVFILSSAAAAIEDVLAKPQDRALAQDAWRIAALVGVDLHMMQVMGSPATRCADLLSYWQTHDPFFLTGPGPA